MNTTTLRFLLRPLLAFALLLGGAAARADVVFDWLDAMPAILKGTSFAGRTTALADLAMFNALNAIDPRYRFFGPAPATDPTASPEAAAASAARTVLSSASGADGTKIANLYRDTLAKVPEGPAKAKGIALGQQAAYALLAMRAADDLSVLVPQPSVAAPGVLGLPVDPKKPGNNAWARLAPLGVARVDAYDPGAPPAVDSAVARRDVAEIKLLGAHLSTTRSADQTAAALFWNSLGDDDFNVLLRDIARARNFSPLDSARMLALADLADFDSGGIAVGRFKDRYRYWRPVHALTGQFADASVRDPRWQPLIVQAGVAAEYPSGAATAAGTFEVILAHFAPPGQPITLRNSHTYQVRSWPNAAAMAEEQALSRVWGGVHFRNTVETSRVMGRKFAEEVLATQLLPR